MLKPVYALVGEDSFLQLQKLGELIREAPKGVQRLDVDGERAELADVLDELRSFAMFGGAKLVVMRNADEFVTKYREQLENYLAAPSDSATLVMRLNSLAKNTRVYKLVVKIGEVAECNPPKTGETVSWAVSRAKTVHNFALPREAAVILVDMIGADLGRLDNELAKLALQCDGGKAIGPDQIRTSVCFQREQEMWDMTNALAAGKTTEALRRWRQLVQLDSSTEFRAVTWLGMWLEKVRGALAMKKEGKNDFAIGTAMKIWPPDQVKPFMENATKLGEAGAGRALDLLTELDLRSKSGLGDATSNVERFLLSVASEN